MFLRFCRNWEAFFIGNFFQDMRKKLQKGTIWPIWDNCSQEIWLKANSKSGSGKMQSPVVICRFVDAFTASCAISAGTQRVLLRRLPLLLGGGMLEWISLFVRARAFRS